MANNTIPNVYGPLVQFLADAIEGARVYGAEVGLKQNDEAALRACLAELAGIPAGSNGDPAGPPGLKATRNAAKVQKSELTTALRTAQAQGRALAMACVNTLKPRLGNQWNNAWQTVGFAQDSLRIPINPVASLHDLRTCYASHPDWEVPNLTPTHSCTAAACQSAIDAIAAADTALTHGNIAAGLARRHLYDGLKSARSRLSGLREELARLIPPDDHRWVAFGFNRPADSGTPGIPSNLTLVAGAPGSGMVFADWDDTRRADGYRARATDAEGNLLAEFLVQDSEATFTGLPSGQKVTISVSARNGSGESRFCEGVEVVVP